MLFISVEDFFSQVQALPRLSREEEQLEALGRAVKHQMNVKGLEQLIERMLREKADRPAVRGVYRDHRMFVNAMMNTVRTLQESGAGVISRVTERSDGVEITVVIPRADRLPCARGTGSGGD